MQKILKNKRLLITLIAGLLVMTVAIGAGTWAWFTSSATVTSGQFTMATVAVSANTISVSSYQFMPDALSDQTNFEGFGDPNPPTAADIAYKAGLFGWFDANKTNATTLLQTDNPATVTPGNILEGTFTITNSSNVPVYFRISGFALTSGAMGINAINNVSSSLAGATFIDGNDGYWYCDTPISSAGGVYIYLQSYIYGGKNDNTWQHLTFNFGNNSAVELIQATNNAVFIDPAWAAVNTTYKNANSVNFFK